MSSTESEIYGTKTRCNFFFLRSLYLWLRMRENGLGLQFPIIDANEFKVFIYWSTLQKTDHFAPLLEANSTINQLKWQLAAKAKKKVIA